MTTRTYKEVNPTKAEATALQGLMILEIQKLIAQGMTKAEILKNLNERRYELSQKAFSISDKF